MASNNVAIDPDQLRAMAQEIIAANQQVKPAENAEVTAHREAIIGLLGELGGMTTGEDKLTFRGEHFVFPARYEGNLPGIHKYLKEYEEAQNAETSMIRFFKAKPFDGAAAMERAMRKHFGSAGKGIPTVTMFGSNPPQRRDVKTGPNPGESISVPWGELHFEPLKATFETGAMYNEDDEYVFGINVTCPKRFEPHVRAFFELIDQEIRENSIYRGKAISIKDGAQEPKFLDVSHIDPSTVAYSETVLRQLSAGLWSKIQHAEQLKALGQELRGKVLVEGPFGTGKSLSGVLTAQVALANKWTYIHVQPGDSIELALQLAVQYGPAVVWIEDIDQVASGTHDPRQIVRVLEALDGVTSKVDGGLLVGMTTNYVEKLAPAVLRPGRIDMIVHVAEPDRPAFEAMIRAVLPEGGADTLDFDQLWTEMGSEWDEHGELIRGGLLPAFVVGAAKDAVNYAVSRSGGKDATVTTTDILDMAKSVSRTLELQKKAQEGQKVEDTVGQAVARVMEHTMERAVVLDSDGDRQAGSYGAHAFTFVPDHSRSIRRRQKHNNK